MSPSRWGDPRSLWNGNYIASVKHALSDLFCYRLMPRIWKTANPMPSRLAQQAARIPKAAVGTAAGAGGQDAWAERGQENSFANAAMKSRTPMPN